MKRIIAIIIFIALGLSTVFTNDTSASTSDIQADESYKFDKLQKLEDEANYKYNLLLKEWAYDKEQIDDIYADFPSFYGGAYINNERGLTIQVTSLTKEVYSYFNKLINLDNVVFEEVKYSFSTLLNAHEQISKKMRDASCEDSFNCITSVGMSILKNAISVSIKKDNCEKTTLLNRIIDETDANEDMIIITYNDECVPADGTVGSPGSNIYNYYGSKLKSRSVGFWATDVYGNLGIVTASHSTLTYGDTVYVESGVFGTVGNSQFGGNVDAAFVNRTNPSIPATRYVSGWNHTISSTTYMSMAVGSYVYIKGAISGCRSGMVTDINVTTTLISNAVKTDIKGEQGDSGGIVTGGGNWNQRYLAGIVFAIDDFKNIYYCKAGHILSALQLSLY